MPGLTDDTDLQHLLLDAAAAQREGDFRRASELLRQALRRDPNDLLAATRLAELEIDQREHASASSRLQAVLRQEPNFAPALAALAHACWLAGRPAEGLAHARRAVAIQPPNPHFRLVLAQLSAWLGHHDEARTELATVLKHPALDDAMHARALGLLGEWHISRGEFEAANAPFRAALALAPDAAAIHAPYGMNLLRLGQLDAGWPEYEWRRRVPFFRPGDTGHALERTGRRWNGEDLRGRTLLIWDDQGFGDAIQFFRYIRMAGALQPARIVHCTLAPLAPLFAATAPSVDVVTVPPILTPGDHQCTSSSLPAVFRTRLDTIPGETPYLAPPPVPRRLRLPGSSSLRVGLAWSGDPGHPRDYQRSIPAKSFLRIADMPGIRFHSLQVAVREQDQPALAACPAIERTGERIRDFAEMAAVVSQLDLVITVDTAVAHLAGALARPVWLLLPAVADWRWLLEREDSPWYPTMRLFRAGQSGWAPVLRRVKHVLRRMKHVLRDFQR